MSNYFSVDWEDWYHTNYNLRKHSEYSESIIVPGTKKLLKLLKLYKSHATFFIVGSLAQKHPDLISEISNSGHEIACHSLWHNRVDDMTQKEFINDTQKCINIIKGIIGKKPLGYRAPSWSVSRQKTPWFWASLKSLGFNYSSSLFPIKTFLYGESQTLTHPNNIDGILEFPISTFSFGPIKIPFSGGFYLRFLPKPLIKYFNLHTPFPHLYYIHPQETVIFQPPIKYPLLAGFIQSYNVKSTIPKLKDILLSPTEPLSLYLPTDK